MALPKARIAMPTEAATGEIVEIKTLVRHPMETGYRVDKVGARIPRMIVESFRVTLAGTEIFAMELTQGVAANPYVSFHTRAVESGDLVFTWTDTGGEVITATRRLTVTG